MSEALEQKDAAFVKAAKGFIGEVRPGIVQRIRVALGKGSGKTKERASSMPFPGCMGRCGTIGIVGTAACDTICPGKRRRNG